MAVVDITLQGESLSDNLAIRDRASNNGAIITRLNKGEEVKVTKQDGNWYYVSPLKTTGSTDRRGWVMVTHVKVTDATAVKENTTEVTVEDQNKAAKEEEDKKAKEQEQARIEEQLLEMENHSNETKISQAEIVDSLLVNNLNGIYGIPYQFMESVDPRMPGTMFGRKYAEKIISKMPLLCITPGKVEFMSNYSKSEQTGILSSLIQGAETDISNIIKNNGRFFTFGFAYKDYFDYVNGLCRVGARFLDINNMEVNIGGTSAKITNYNWENALNKHLKATLTSQEFIGFYMDSANSVSESFSNDTVQSQLSSTVNGFSDLAREIGFLLGAGAGVKLQLMDEAGLAQSMQTIEDLSNQYLGGSNLFKNIANGFATIATGGKLLFPEIWSDSHFSRSFDITIKLRTPDADVVSWYLNIYVPLCHLIALAAGHQTENLNGYHSPFLVRAFYKGLFNVDMGIITDMSITKGKEASWNIDGLPTEIDVNITIKDLYNMLSISPGGEAKNFVTNNILMDYIANTCGININQMDIQRSLHIYHILKSNSITDIPNKTNRYFQDAIDTFGMNMFDAFKSKFLI